MSPRLALSFALVVAVAASAHAVRRAPDFRGNAVQPPPSAVAGAQGLVLERLGEVSVDVDGLPRPAVGWSIEADPAFLATIPRELRVRGADPAAGRMRLVLRVAIDHPAVARTEAMIRRMHARWAGISPIADAPPRPLSMPALPPDGCVDACVMFSCDGAGNLYKMLQSQGGGTFYFLGNMGVTMFDLATSADRHLYGLSAGDLYLINGCTAEVTLLGPSSLADGLCADLVTGGLIAGGPPIEEIPLPRTAPVPIGGSCCGQPPQWCAPPWGDITETGDVDRLLAALPCASCGGDMLVAIDPTSGAVTEEVACLIDGNTQQPISHVTAIAVDSTCTCRVILGFADSEVVYAWDARVGEAYEQFGLPNGETFGFAATTSIFSCPMPLSCRASADPPDCSSVRLHATARDPGGNPVSYLWTTQCPGATFAPRETDADPLVTVDGGCRTCAFDLAVDAGPSGTCSRSVTVAFADVPPPVVTASAAVSCLWPPDHRFVDVGLSVTASDACASPDNLVLSIASVTSDEATATEPGTGGPLHAPDAIVDGLTVRLRAERSGASDGRVYRITVKAVDPCGSEGEAVVEVRVPHDASADRRRHAPGDDCPAVDSGQVHDATARN
jgi:hypothetical protein